MEISPKLNPIKLDLFKSNHFISTFQLILLILFIHLLNGTNLAVIISTDDGFTMNLFDSNGQINSLQIEGQTIPLFSNITGGFYFSEGSSINTISTTYYHNFNSDTPAWNNAINDNWNSSNIYYSWESSGGIDNSRFIRLGNGSNTGCGIALNEPVSVTSGIYRFSWYGRATDTTTKYIFCIRLFDESGNDITQNVSPPSGWIYTSTSKAHLVFGMSNQNLNTWEKFEYEYTMSPDVKWITLSLRYWTGGDYNLQVDDLMMEKIGGIDWGGIQYIPLSLNTSIQPGKYWSTVIPTNSDLSIQITYSIKSQSIQLDAELEDISIPQKDRIFQFYYVLPVDANGWIWEDDIYTQRTISTTSIIYENTFTMLDRGISKYPFNGISNSSTGMIIATPMDNPRIQKIYYQNNKGLIIKYDIALSPTTFAIGTGRADFRFTLYKSDEPEWGFRSMVKKYYTIYPEYFTKRTPVDGAWEYPIAPTLIPNPEDFGFKFFETSPQSSTVVAYCQENGIEIYHYHEPWGIWQNLGYVTTKPSYAERVQLLNDWASDTLSLSTWMRAPRWYTAQAVLNSSYLDDSSQYLIDADDYFWHQWSGSSAWNQFWPVNSSSSTIQPNTGTLYKDYFVDYKSNEKEGMYVDSIAVNFSLGNLENYRFSHFSTAGQPLTFSLKNGRPIIARQLQQYDYLDWISNYLHSQNKKVMGNIFSYAYRYYSHLLDILGCEVFETTENESLAILKRTLSYQKNNTNLLQYWETNFLTKDDIETYIKDQMFYGFFPGISSGGGGVNYGAPERYFLHPELYERDRDLFQKYIPIIRNISQAGWEPITYISCSNDSIRLERFGDWTSGSVYFTVKNKSSISTLNTLEIETYSLGIPIDELTNLEINNLLDNTKYTMDIDINNGQLSFPISLIANEIHVIQLKQKSPANIPKSFWEFY